jgi:UDPglucose--hexose-1-phosphate uridylyltransferase
MTNKKSEIRKDYIQEKYVIIAPRRTSRPHSLVSREPVNKQFDDNCGFCPNKLKSAKFLYKIGTQKNWDIAVLANKYPAVTLNNSKAYGQQEVVIETPDHIRELEDLPVDQLKDLLTVYAERTKAIAKNKKIEYIMIFKNNGGIAGASLQHSHSQIFATNFLPPHLADKSQRQQAYKLKHGTCVYCDVIKKEARSPRFVWQDDKVIAFTPYASMFNYELWIMPKRHMDNITLLKEEEKMSWAKILKHSLQKISQLNLPYNYYFHQVIHDEDQHLYMKVAPRGSVWAGVEIGSGLIINPIAPEEAAKFYRQGL